MNKYTQYLDSNEGESKLLEEMFDQVEQRDFEKAYGTAMRIKAIKDIKFSLKQIDERNK